MEHMHKQHSFRIVRFRLLLGLIFHHGLIWSDSYNPCSYIRSIDGSDHREERRGKRGEGRPVRITFLHSQSG